MNGTLTENEISRLVIASCNEVYKELGPGLLENVYETCLSYELALRGLKVECQKKLPLIYKGVHLDTGYNVDILVNKKVIIEVKAVETLEELHTTQLLTYLKLSDLRVGLLVNFNVALIKNGIKRVVREV